MKPRLLVVGADSLRGGGLVSMSRTGCSVTLVDAGTTHQYESLVDEFAFASSSDSDCDMEAMERLADRHDAVVTLSDGSQAIAAALAARLGSPSPGLKAAAAARDKQLQRSLLTASGLRQPRFAQARDPFDAERFLIRSSSPVIVKPADGGGGLGVTLASTPEQARRAWHIATAFSKSRSVIVEEFVPGVEISAEAVIVDGCVVSMALTDKTLGGPGGLIELSHTSTMTHPWTNVVRPELDRVLSAVEFETGVIHAEFRVASEAACLIEFGARPAGGLIPEVTKLATGIDLYASLAGISLKEPLQPAAEPSASCAIVRFLIGAGSVRRRVTAADVDAGRGSIYAIGQLVPPGCRVPRPTGNWGYVGYVIGAGDDKALVSRDLADASEQILDAMGLTDLGGTESREKDGIPAVTEAS